MKKKMKLSRYTLFSILLITFIILVNFPINRNIIKISIILMGIALYIYSIYILWKKRPLRYLIIGIAPVIIFISMLSGPPVSGENLTNTYIDCLKKYEGTTYLWGGENRFGIDCSGLVRKGLMDAYTKVGFSNFSPQYFRKALYLWFYDSSAQALRDGYRNYTTTIIKDITLNSLDHSMLRLGDIMVTEDGVHTMAYIGNSQWIQADPGKHKVIIESAPSSSNTWYNARARIVRWNVLN